MFSATRSLRETVAFREDAAAFPQISHERTQRWPAPRGAPATRKPYRKRRGNCLMIPLLSVSAIMRMWRWILS